MSFFVLFFNPGTCICFNLSSRPGLRLPSNPLLWVFQHTEWVHCNGIVGCKAHDVKFLYEKEKTSATWGVLPTWLYLLYIHFNGSQRPTAHSTEIYKRNSHLVHNIEILHHLAPSKLFRPSLTNWSNIWHARSIVSPYGSVFSETNKKLMQVGVGTTQLISYPVT